MRGLNVAHGSEGDATQRVLGSATSARLFSATCTLSIGGAKGTPRPLRSRTARYRSPSGSSQTVLALTLPEPSRVRVRFQSEKRDQARRLPDLISFVDAMGHYGNRRPRVERLVSAWNQGSGGVAAPVGKPDDPFIGASAEPRRRTRTPLTEAEVDAMRTARGQGVSVNALARRFGVHRATVWAKTR